MNGQTLYEKLDSAIQDGEITEQEAREIYAEQQENGGYPNN